jgi:polysaccharide biosynthesis/export protein
MGLAARDGRVQTGIYHGNAQSYRNAEQERWVLLKLLRAAATGVALILVACQGAPPAPPAPELGGAPPEYVIGPGDKVNVFVWRNPELSANVAVRPDGRISTPLVEDVLAVGKTPAILAREMEGQLKKYVKEPVVTIMMDGFVGPFEEQVRVIGEAATPRALPYRANMTVLDAMIEVGGLTKYAAGNDAVLIRTADGRQSTYSVRLDSLIKDGNVASNVALQPGDILIIPQRLF